MIDSTKKPNNPRDMTKADADIILAIHHLQSSSSFDIKGQHVYAHQDTRIRVRKEPRSTGRRRVVINSTQEADMREKIAK